MKPFRQVFTVVPLLLSISWSLGVKADDLLAVTVEQTSTAKSPDEASREITSKVMSQTARDQVIEMIGEAKYQKNQRLIESKIVREASRFIPFVNPRQPVATGDGFKMSVDLQVSQASLRSMILATGLLADSETPGTLLSLVSVTDKASLQSYRWWTGESDDSKKFLMSLNADWTEAVTNELTKKGFKLAAPKGSALTPVTDEKALLSTVATQMVIRGEIRVRESTDAKAGLLAMKVGVFQTRDNRLIADLVRTQQVENASTALLRTKAKVMFNEVSRDLTAAILEAWQNGVIGSSIIKITLKGTLTPKQLADFKTEFLHAVHDVKTLKERRFEAGQVTFEGDAVAQPAQVSEHARTVQLPSFQTQVLEQGTDGLVISVRPRR